MERLGQNILKRYDRQISLDEIGIGGQQKLQDANVLVIGAGGLGCPLLLYLAGAGVGRIGIIDHDVVDESNLHRQILYHVADIGKPKADVAAAKLQLFNPNLQIVAYPFKLATDNATSLFNQYDLVIDGSDNFPTRYLVNDTCVSTHRPLVFGSIFQFEGQVSVFNLNGGPDYRSIYPEPPEDSKNCGESGVIGTLPGIIGSIMANEAIKIICGFGETLSGKLLTFNTLNNQIQCFKFNNTPIQAVSQRITKQTQQISLTELEDWKIKNKAFTLIDVRENYEFEENNIGGINIPLYELNNHLDEISKHKTIVFCCSMGRRSKIAMQLLKHKAELYSVILK